MSGRIFSDFITAFNEIKRDLGEMGIRVHPQTYQDKFVGDNPDFATRELQNYMYTVTSGSSNMIPNVIQPWADAEFEERMSGLPLNPGEAWKLREQVWSQFLTEEGKFGYSYPERISANDALNRIIDRVKTDPDSRQLTLSIWDPSDIQNIGGISRVPCSLVYQFQVRQGTLNLTYIQRSCDFGTHFYQDVYLARRLQEYIAEKTGYPAGIFTHLLLSLHIFQKDVKNVF